MPKLPEYQKERDTELIDKPDWGRGVLAKSKKAFVPRRPLKIPKKLIGGIVMAALVLAVSGLLVWKFGPAFLNMTKRTPTVKPQAFEYPVDASKIKFPSDFIKNKFSMNLDNASKETDLERRYVFLEDDFKLLLNSYAQTQSYDMNVALAKYKEYIQKNYPDKYIQNKPLYDFPCLDKVCGGNIKYPAEINELKKSISENTAINAAVRDGILRNFDAAAISSDKNYQGTVYANTLYSLGGEYRRTNDAAIKDIWQKLYDFVSKNYPDIKIIEDQKIK